MSPTTKKVVIIVISLLVLGMIAFAVLFFMRVENANKNTNTQNTNEAPVNATVGLDNTNTNEQANTNTEPTGSVASNQPVTSEGVVFIKGYKTPSESYGILTNDGFEIGFGKYDSMREQFRPYVGEQISVVFSSICRTSNENCCRTLFTFCGTVDTFTPIEE